MARPSNASERRAQIVAALLTVMSERGYERASIQQIGKAAGLTPGLVHYHFKNKQQILLALVDSLVARFEARRERYASQAVAAPRAQLQAWVNAALALDEEAAPEVVTAWVFVGAEALRQAEVGEVYRVTLSERRAQLHSLVTAVLSAEGRATSNDAQLVALTMSVVEGAYQLGSAAPELLPRGFAATGAWEALASMLDAQPTAGR